MIVPEFDIAIRNRRWACVVDPMLALATPLGAQLVQRLSTVLDLWVVRSFWQTLDASEFYRRDPLAFWPSAMHERQEDQGNDVVTAIRLWEQVRARTDLSRCNLHWVSDNLSESALTEQAPEDLVERYETLHQALAARADPSDELTETAGFFGLLDALSLAAALGPIRMLTLAPAHPLSTLAAACRLLDLPLQTVAADALLDLERQRLHGLLVEAGASPLLWAGLPIATVQILLPATVPVALQGDGADGLREPSGPFEEAIDTGITAATPGLWRDARLFCDELPTGSRACIA